MSEFDDPFDGASPSVSHLHGSGIYDDLGEQILNQGIDQSMPDFQEEFHPSTSALDNIAMSDFNTNISDARAFAQSEDNGAGTLPDFLTESYQDFPSKSLSIGAAVPEIKETNGAEPEKSRRSVTFLDGKEPTSDLTPAQNEATNRVEVLIKKENDGDSLDWTSMPDEIISIHDSEDGDDVVMLQPDGCSVAIKKENDGDLFDWTSMPDEIISIHDSDVEDDVVMLQPDGRSVAIKKENDEVEFLWEKMDDRVIEINSDDEANAATKYNLGRSILKGRDFKGSRRPHYDSTAIRKVQEAYLLKRRLEHGIPEPSSTRGVPSGLRLQNPKRSDLLIDAEGSDWMNAEYTPDDKGGRIFRELKKNYNAKVKKGYNSVEDDIEFVKSEKAEKLRLARLKAEYEDARGYSDDDNSDHGLFVSPAPTGTSHSKRRADDPNTEPEVVDLRSPKQRKSNKSGKQTQKDFDRERENNMLAGIEDFLRNMNDQEGGKSGKKGRGKSGGKAKAGKKDGPKRTKRTPNQVGYLNNSDSLLTSNVYEDADANLDREALPTSGFTNKQKALTALVASVPLGTTIKDATAEKNHILKSTVILGRNISGTCKADGQNNWKLTGMKASLLHHQVQAAAFMKERETGGEEPLGGILADAMGMGKTLTAIGLMISNPPPRGEKRRATLIVCTPALLVQWKREIEKHTEEGVLDDVLEHYAATRIAGKGAINAMQGQEVILTTYQEVVKSYPKLNVPEDIHDEEGLKSWWRGEWSHDIEVLHQAHFYRIILDESQYIKNHESQTSIACRALMAKHRWCLSATPIMNRVDELYPTFKFLRVPFTGSYSNFQDNYCKPGNDDCNSRLHCLLDQIMCRRTLKDTVLGAPIVKLPKHHQRTCYVEFSPVENAIYRRVLKKFVGMLNKASADGKLEKHPGLGLVAFLRMRQLCAHTFLVQEVLEEMIDLESIDAMESAFICGAMPETPENKNDRILLEALRRMIKAKPEVVEQPEDFEEVQTGELAAKLGRYLKSLKSKSNWAELRTRTLCYFCGEPPESAMVTSCLHVYCGECLQGMANSASAKDQDKTTCLKCGVAFTGAESCAGLKELEWNNNWLLNQTTSHKSRPKKVNMEWVAFENKLVMSAKTTAVQVQVQQWLEEEPDKKIIIFSQFHMTMRILEEVCQQKMWKYCNYNGHQSHAARDKAITDFTNDDDMKIMIASLRAGGIGLNLTMASKVVCIDLWFNSCIEQQAFCRVFRISQDSETFITRFVVNGSADAKLMEMQLKKDALIGQAMDDRSVLSKLTINEILRLFGEITFDRNSRPFIHLADDEKLDSLFEKRDEKE